jgi:hypothetical protein
VFEMLTVPPLKFSNPATPPSEAVFIVIVLLLAVIVPWLFTMPLPEKAALLVMVLLVTVRVPQQVPRSPRRNGYQ